MDFSAEYESGEIKIDDEEIVAAGWFDPHELPTSPEKISIARKLIEWPVDAKLREKVVSP